jgi:peptide/nickel transport system substrate-binding protein
MKKLLSVLLAIVVLVSVAACGGTPAAPAPAPGGETPAAPAAPAAPADPAAPAAPAGASAEKEAPVLAARVASGELPPLAERLPVAGDVMVEPDIIALGQYGGSATTTYTDNGRWNWGPITEQSMFRFKQDGSGEVEANVCKEFSANADSTVWTIKLREGMKWSDGAPFTADDVVFYYDHMSVPALNADRTAMDTEAEGYFPAYTSKPYNCYQATKDGKKYWAVFNKVNDYEFTVTFAAPKPSFAVDAAVDNKWMFLPKHFYTKYVARKDGVSNDASFPLITEEEALANANKDFGKQWENYGTMSKDIGYYNWDYAVIPQLRSFIAVKDNHNAVGETYELVRNPYFWKTDSEGRQLPYLDSIKVKIINEQDQVALQAMSGEFDIGEFMYNFSTIVTAIKDTHTLKPLITPKWSNEETIQLNQTVKDLDKRALFQDKRFRQALSICVDRKLLSDTLRNGVNPPAQASLPAGMPGHDPEWSSKWTEYNVEAANALLDEITEPWDRTPETYRLMKGTNKEAEIILSVKEPSESGDFTSLLQAAYKAVGVRLSIKVDADYRTTMLSNDVEASVEVTSASTPALRPDSIIPMRNVAVWHSAYGKWYEDGRSTANGGVEPTGDVLELINAYEAMQTAAGPNRDATIAENVKKVYDLHKENIWLIGYLETLPTRLPVNNHLLNVPEGIVWVDEFRYWSMLRPEQWYRDDA